MVSPTGAGHKKLNLSLTGQGDVLRFEISPDSTRIAYLADAETDETFELYSIRLEGMEQTKLSQTLVASGDVHNIPNEPASFIWSADSQFIAYLATQEKADQVELFTTSVLDLSNQKLNIAMNTNGDVTDFSWSPDNTRIAYLADHNIDGIFELFSVRKDGSDQQKVNKNPLPAQSYISGFTWSPDSMRIAYLGDQNTFDVDELFTSFPDGTGNTTVSDTLINGGHVVDFSW